MGAAEAIRQAALRYCRGVDRLDPELMLSAYHDGATDDHGIFSGPAAAPRRCRGRRLRRVRCADDGPARGAWLRLVRGGPTYHAPLPHAIYR